MKIQDGYSRLKHPPMVDVRPMTLAEVQALHYGNHVSIICNDGKLRDAKVNGEPKRWKTRPDDVEVSLKYGMYEYARLSKAEALAMLVVRVQS